MAEKFSSHLVLAKSYWNDFLQESDQVVDATCGNGHDTLFLAQKVPLGRVFAFDINEKAIQNTRALLKEHGVEDRVSLFQASHEQLSLIPSKAIRLVVYNLGYLPGGDKKITTMAESTRNSLFQALSLVETSQGAVSIMCYPGHEEGRKEQDLLLQELTSLDSRKWQVSFHQWVNRPLSPSFFWVKNISLELR
jgi:tRNA1(Val) A37 N6-methylase TrmN6